MDKFAQALDAIKQAAEEDAKTEAEFQQYLSGVEDFCKEAGIDPDSILDAILDEEVIKAAYKVRDPKALAAAIGRKKYGRKRFQEMAAAGRKKKASEEEEKDAAQKGREIPSLKGGKSEPAAKAPAGKGTRFKALVGELKKK